MAGQCFFSYWDLKQKIIIIIIFIKQKKKRRKRTHFPCYFQNQSCDADSFGHCFWVKSTWEICWISLGIQTAVSLCFSLFVEWIYCFCLFIYVCCGWDLIGIRMIGFLILIWILIFDFFSGLVCFVRLGSGFWAIVSVGYGGKRETSKEENSTEFWILWFRGSWINIHPLVIEKWKGQ